MTPYQQELLENLRKSAERGLALAQAKGHELIDTFQHILDEIERLGEGE